MERGGICPREKEEQFNGKLDEKAMDKSTCRDEGEWYSIIHTVRVLNQGSISNVPVMPSPNATCVYLITHLLAPSSSELSY